MIPLRDLREYLRIDTHDSDALLEDLERAAVAHVERVTGLFLGPPQARTETITGTGNRYLILRQVPQPGTAVTVTDQYERTITDFRIIGRTLFRDMGWGSYGWPVFFTVTYTVGVARHQEPRDAWQAVLLLVAHWYENRVPAVTGAIAGEVPLTVNALLGSMRSLSL